VWKDKNIYDEAAAGYDMLIRRFVPCYDAMQGRVVDTVAELCGTSSSLKLVELGVGTGALAYRVLSDLPVDHYCGYEMSPSLASLARARLSLFGADAIVEEADFREAAWPTDVSAIVSTLTFHYLANSEKAQVFRKCFHSLGSRGVLVVGDRVISRNARCGAVYHSRMTRFWDQATVHWTEQLRLAHKTQDDPKEEPWYLEDQLDLLKTVGFAEVECIWKDFNYCVFCGIRD